MSIFLCSNEITDDFEDAYNNPTKRSHLGNNNSIIEENKQLDLLTNNTGSKVSR